MIKSNHKYPALLWVKWIISVRMYGAFGKKRSQTAIKRRTINFRRILVTYRVTAINHGINASIKFQIRNTRYTVPLIIKRAHDKAKQKRDNAKSTPVLFTRKHAVMYARIYLVYAKCSIDASSPTVFQDQ